MSLMIKMFLKIYVIFFQNKLFWVFALLDTNIIAVDFRQSLNLSKMLNRGYTVSQALQRMHSSVRFKILISDSIKPNRI